MKTFADVLAHLRSHPRVSMISPDSRITFAEGVHTFHGAERGLMWFKGPDGVLHHLPIDCGMTAAESGVRVRADGFDLTKFGVTIVVTFLDAPSPPAKPRDLVKDLARNWELPKPGGK